MSTWLLVPFILPVFFARDFFLLRMGPPAATSIRLLTYSIVLLGSAIFFRAGSFFQPTVPLTAVFGSRPLLLSVVFLYAVQFATCLWVRRTGRHDIAWLVAASPNPLLAIGLAGLAQPVVPESSPGASIVGTVLLSGLWIAFMNFSVRKESDVPMDGPDCRFSLGVAALVNSAAFLILPLQALADRGDSWTGFCRQLAGMLSVD